MPDLVSGVPIAHLVVLALTDAEALTLRDALAHELGDDMGLAPDVAAVVERLEQALTEALAPELPVHGPGAAPTPPILHLPTAGRFVTGPGVTTALRALTAATADGRSARDGWSSAAVDVAIELAAAVLRAQPPQVTRPLARLVAACRSEAERAEADRPARMDGEGLGLGPDLR